MHVRAHFLVGRDSTRPTVSYSGQILAFVHCYRSANKFGPVVAARAPVLTCSRVSLAAYVSDSGSVSSPEPATMSSPNNYSCAESERRTGHCEAGPGRNGPPGVKPVMGHAGLTSETTQQFRPEGRNLLVGQYFSSKCGGGRTLDETVDCTA